MTWPLFAHTSEDEHMMLPPNTQPATLRFRSSINSFRAFVTAIAVSISGCGTSGDSMTDPVKAENMLSRISSAIGEKDWDTAESTASAAIEAKILNASQVEDALIARAKSRLESRDLEGAGMDLATLENSKTPGKADQIFVLKATYQLKSGKKADARKTFLMAKKINGKIKAPAGL